MRNEVFHNMVTISVHLAYLSHYSHYLSHYSQVMYLSQALYLSLIAISYSCKYSWGSATMKITPDKEPTLTDVLRKLDELSDEVKKFDERFSNYQQATQWLIQLAFGLIAIATVIVIVSNVLN